MADVLGDVLVVIAAVVRHHPDYVVKYFIATRSH